MSPENQNLQQEQIKEKQKAVGEALKHLEKLGIQVRKLGDQEIASTESIPTGSLTLDLATGINGYPKGRIVELFGRESSGKSLLSLSAIAKVQKQGGLACLIDAESGFDPTWAAKLGVDVQNLYLQQPDSGEDALEAADELIRSGGFSLIVIDSTAALVPKAELEGKMEDQTIGLQARLISKALRKLTMSVCKTKTVLLFINQIRDQIGVYGDPTTTPGGRALKFYASMRIQVSAGTKYKDEEDRVIGHLVKAKIVKNKCAPPFRTAEFDLYYEKGIDKSGEIVAVGITKNIIKIEGNTYSFGDKKAIGEKKFRTLVQEDRELRKAILAEIRK
jgi:recombination protein RecA